MAASAYAALASLSHALEQIQHPARHQLLFDRSQIGTLHEMVQFMLNFFEAHSTAVYDTDEEDVLRTMANCITEAEDVIDSYVVDQLSQRSADKADMGFCEAIEEFIQKFRTLKEVFAELREKKKSSQEQKPSVSMPAAAGSSAPPAPFGKNSVVGIEDHMDRIKDWIMGGESGLQIVPIVGMGGIGKTTLAQSIFHDPCLKKYFDMSIWFTISQEYSVPNILIGLLGQVGENESSSQEIAELGDNESIRKKIAELGQKLRKKLFGQRYLIVLDDVWSTNVWDDLKLYFPDTGEGSRIIVTTRLFNISDSLGHENSYSIDLLDDEKSWDLLREKVFGKENCPDPELEEIGRTIAGGCKGLPLAIVVVGGMLAKSDITLEKWEEVAQNVNSIFNSEGDEHYLNILSLSYNHLPIHLKPCFLYMRVYPEDYNIGISTLIQSWIAEGFVISRGGKTLEEVAEEYLKDLTARNLILSHNKFGYGGKMIKTCGVHDLVRELCLREYKRENTFHITKVFLCEIMQELSIGNRSLERNICHLCSDRYGASRAYFRNRIGESSDAYSVVCHICKSSCPGRNTLRLVDIIQRRKRPLLPLPSKMRYLHVRDDYYFFNCTWLHLFWNLRSIVFYSSRARVINLPSEVWKMPQLRHVKFQRATLPEPPGTPVDGRDSIILENLETLGTIVDFNCSEEIVARIPNLKKLKICGVGAERDLSYHQLHNLTHLHKLESLSISFTTGIMKEFFPLSLKKLTLKLCKIPWEEMTIIGSIPNLEVLKLYDAFSGEEWNPVEGEFLQLKSLSISWSSLVSWNAEKEHFPKLEFLLLCYMENMDRIPSGIGEIQTLLSIDLFRCTENVVNSAEEIVEEQLSYGNVGFQLHLHDE